MAITSPKVRMHALTLGIYTAAVFLSALLLFAVQPMFTRMVLPRLGGSPSVWSVAMVFFQAMLLAGYAYAHALTTLRTRYAPVVIHLALLILAGFTLPLGIAQGFGSPPAGNLAALWLLGLFAVSIGLPFLALSASNPLLQTWFVCTGHREAHDPYFLYAASNVGSFLALLAYPALFEPAFSLQSQNRLWSFGFAVLIVLFAACAVLMLRAARRPAPHKKQKSAPALKWMIVGRWIFISAVPSGLLVAVTAHISTDVAAAPLLWVIPLSLYLLTWVLVFQRRSLIPHRIALLLQPFAIGAIVVLLFYSTWVPLFLNLGGHLLAFFVICLACHGELARTRPPARRLTTFYLSLSFGGMIGGLFAGLVAPYIFSWVAEYPILAVLAALCRPFKQNIWKPYERWLRPLSPARWPQLATWFWPAAVAIAILVLVPAFGGAADDDEIFLTTAVIALVAISVVAFRDPPKSAFAVAIALAAIRLYPSGEYHIETMRSFFGVHKIYETDDGRFRILKHGSTIHGAQMIADQDGKPVAGHPVSITYYHDKSAMNQVIQAVRARKAAPLRTAVIGLGAGSLACRIAPAETWHFFEIDPVVVEIARDPRRFSYLSSCAPQLPVVLGDARLTLAHEPDRSYDLIIVDAYSSDAIPVHLATTEAMALYRSKLAPHGVVLMHISNRYLELKTVVAGIAAANGLKTWLWDNPDEQSDDENYVFTSDVAIAAEDADDIGELKWNRFWALTPPDPAVRTWTDDYSNVAGALWRRYTK
ncbi:MAG TPA: fused MFS/spermidine synthase [Pseudolabrys sp.]|nr:fused MFS/spermidine synthase [Pseudolabrys sp.]